MSYVNFQTFDLEIDNPRYAELKRQNATLDREDCKDFYEAGHAVQTVASSKMVDGVEIKTVKTVFCNQADLIAEVGTNGTKAYFRLTDGGTGFFMRVNGVRWENLVIDLDGKSGVELRSFIDALKFAIATLEEQMR